MGNKYLSTSSGPDRSRAALVRDAAVARVRRTRRWVIAGAAALTAGFAALVSAVAPGRTLTAAKGATGTERSGAAASTASNGAAIPRMPAPANASDLGLQSPEQAPSPSPGDSQPQSAPSQSQSAPSQTQSTQSQPQGQPDSSQAAPAPAPPVVSGGS